MLVGLLFSLLVLSTHKHAGKLKKKKKRPFLVLRVCHHVSELDVKFSKKHLLKIVITKETAVIKGSLMFKYWLVAQD